MRSYAQPPHLNYEPFGFVVLVGAKRLLMGTGEVCCQLLLLRRRLRLGGIPLTGACGLCDRAIDDQVMTVVHEHVSPIAQLSWMGIGFAGQQRYSYGEDCVYGIGAGAMGARCQLRWRRLSNRRRTDGSRC